MSLGHILYSSLLQTASNYTVNANTEMLMHIISIITQLSPVHEHNLACVKIQLSAGDQINIAMNDNVLIENDVL